MQKAVVVVDDDPHIRFGLKAGFEQAGYTVVSGPNIETAAAVLDMNGGGFRPVLISRTPSFFKALRYQCVS